MKVTFHGHAAVQLDDGEHSVIIDPWLSGNPVARHKPEDIRAKYILLSHAHSDHFGDTVEIARQNDALVISTFEVANLARERGVGRVHGMHLGGQHTFPFGRVRVTLAFHGAGVAGGHACGFVVAMGGKTAYHAGDTALFGDMRLLGDLEQLDLAFLPIGSNYTMGPDDAVVAATLLRAKEVVPIHYNTFDLIAQDAADWKRRVERNAKSVVRIVEPGGHFEI